MTFSEFITEQVAPNIWGAILMAVAWIANVIKNKSKDKAETDSSILDNAKKIIEMSEGIANRFEVQNQKLSDSYVQMQKAVEDLTFKERTCQERLSSVMLESEKFKAQLILREAEIKEIKKECQVFRKSINYEKDETCGDINFSHFNN